MYDILGFLSFLYFLPFMQQTFFFLTFLEFIQKVSFKCGAIENVFVLFYHSFHIHYVIINWYDPTNFYLLPFSIKLINPIQTIHTLLNYMRVFYKYSLWYFYCPWNVSFLKYVQLQCHQNILHYHHQHIMISNEFMLICTHQNFWRAPHPMF